MVAIIKRNLRIYFSNTAAVIFSMLGAWIAFVLYIIFLQKNLQESFGDVPQAKEILDRWVMGGVLAVTGITSTWSCVSLFVKDRESSRLEDFLLTDTPFAFLQFGYLLAGVVVGFLSQLVVYGIMTVYFVWQDGLQVDLDQQPPMLAMMLLSSILGATLGLWLAQWFQQTVSAERFSIMIGTASGFLVGVYMPIGMLPEGAKWLIKLTPGAYVAAGFRQMLSVDNVSDIKLPDGNLDEFLGFGLDWDGLTGLSVNIGIICLLIVASVFLLLTHPLVKGFRKR